MWLFKESFGIQRGVMKISALLLLNASVAAYVAYQIAHEYGNLVQPTAWGIIFVSFILLLSFANMLVALRSFRSDSKIPSLLCRVLVWLSGLSFAVAVYMIWTDLKATGVDQASFGLGIYCCLLLFFIFLFAAKRNSWIDAIYQWLIVIGNLVLLAMVFIHTTTEDAGNAALFFLIGLNAFFNIYLVTKLIWGEFVVVEEVSTPTSNMSFYDTHKRELYFYASIIFTLIVVFATPVSFCAHLGGLCTLGLKNELTRALLYIPFLVSIIVVRNIRSWRLFIELLTIFILTLGGGLLATHTFIKWSDLRGLDNIAFINVLIAVWISSMIFLLTYQSLLIPFRRRMLLYVPIIACQFLLSIFASLQLSDTVMPPPPSISFNWPGGCFPEGTLVWTPRGNLPIESLAAGDRVFARDIHSQKVIETPVIASLVKQRSEVVIINYELKVTPEHPMAILESDKVKWREAGKLEVGNCLVSSLGECRMVRSIQHLDVSPITVVNLSVASPHDFFVLMGEKPVLVHNKTYPTNFGPPPPDYSNELNILSTSSAVVVAKVRSIDWLEHSAALGVLKEAVYTLQVVSGIRGARTGTIRVQPVVSDKEIYKIGSTYVFFLAPDLMGSSVDKTSHAEYIANLKYDAISDNTALSIDQLKVISEKNETVIKLEGLLLPSHFNGKTFEEYLKQRLQDIREVREKTNAGATWTESMQFLNTCEVDKVVQVNSASSRVEYRLNDKSHYVVSDKVAVDEVKRVVEEANKHCGKAVSVKLPRFMSWDNVSYYLNHCSVDQIETYYDNAEAKIYLKDKTFSTIEASSLPPISEIKSSALKASTVCGSPIPIKLYPEDIENPVWVDWSDAGVLLNKCVITGIWINKDKSGNETTQLFTKDNRVLKLNKGIDKETANTAAINSTKKCGLQISSSYTDQAEQ